MGLLFMETKTEFNNNTQPLSQQGIYFFIANQKAFCLALKTILFIKKFFYCEIYHEIIHFYNHDFMAGLINNCDQKVFSDDNIKQFFFSKHQKSKLSI